MVRQMRLIYDNEGCVRLLRRSGALLPGKCRRRFKREREAFRLAIYLTLIRTTRALLNLFEKFASRPASSREEGPERTSPPASPSTNATLRREAGLKKLRLQPLVRHPSPCPSSSSHDRELPAA